MFHRLGDIFGVNFVQHWLIMATNPITQQDADHKSRAKTGNNVENNKCQAADNGVGQGNMFGIGNHNRLPPALTITKVIKKP